MSMIRISTFLLITLFVLSCSTVREGQIYQQFEEEDVQIGSIEDEDIILEVAYVGAIGHSYIFECYIKNTGEESLFIDKSQFSLSLEDQRILAAHRESDLIASLKSDQQTLKKRKKSSTILGGIVIGLSVIAGATDGIGAGESLLYNADPIIGIFDERRWYQRNIESVEDEITYIKNAQFNDSLLSPGEDMVRDLLFPTVRINSDVDLIVEVKEREFVITFPEDIFH